MDEFHMAYLNLGSNIQPESNIPKAVESLSVFGEVVQISQVWESEPVGTTGNNYLNVCVKFKTNMAQSDVKAKIIRPIENQLGRQHSHDKFAPRPMDIDIILFDDESINDAVWELAFVVVPLADLYPEYQNPMTGEFITETATRLRREVWLETRRGGLG